MLNPQGAKGNQNHALTESKAEFHFPGTRMTEVGSAEGITEIEGEGLVGEIANIKCCKTT